MMADVGAETWIMHGSLLGWWWNQKVRPNLLALSAIEWATLPFELN